MLERDGGLAGERLGQLLVARGEGPSGPEGQHADRAVGYLERDAEELGVAQANTGRANRVGDRVPVPELGLQVGPELVVDHEPRARERQQALDDLLRELVLVVGSDAVVAALHRREPCALPGDVVEHEVGEAAQELRIVGAQRLLDRLGMSRALEDADDVRALPPAAERLRVVEVEQGDDEVRLGRVAVRRREPDSLERLADQLRETVERFRARSAVERVLHGYEPN